MPGFIDIQIIGDQAGVNAMIEKIDLALSPVGLELFMQTIVEPWLQERAENRFNNEGDSAVGSWAPLSPATEMIRSQKGYGADHPINKRTGQLEDYITQTPARTTQLGAGASLTFPGVKATGELENKVKVAQVGSRYPATVPRPVLGMNEDDLLFVLGGLAKFIQGL